MKLLFIFLFSTLTALAQTPEWSRKYHTGSVTCLDFSSDGKMLLSGGKDKKVVAWDIVKQDSLKVLLFKSAVQSVDSYENDLLLVSTNSWNGFQTGSNESYLLKLSDSGFKKVFTSNISFQGSAFKDIDINVSFFKDSQIININSGIIELQDPTHYTGAYTSIFSSDSLLPKKQFQSFPFDYNSLAISLDKRFFHGSKVSYYSYYRGPSYQSITAAIFDFQDSKAISFPHNKFEPLEKAITSAATFTADSKKLLTANKAGSIHVRSVPEGVVIDSLGSQTSLATALAADMQGRYYFSAHEDTTLRIWIPGVHNIFKRIPLQSLVTTIAVSPDSIHFATAHHDGTVSYWNIDSLFLKAKTDSVFTPFITLHPESKTVCRGSEVVFKTQAVSNFGEEVYYQWRKNSVKISDDANYSGAQSAELKINNAGNAHIGKYSVLAFTSKGDSILSFTSNLSFVPPLPGISLQNDTVRLKNGEQFALSVWLSDTAKYAYQWYHDGVPVTGFKESYAISTYYLKINNANPEKDNGIYVLKYWNECDTISSKPIFVEVQTGMSAEENPFKNTTLSAEPNPFKNSTTIRFSLPNSLKIKLAVTDVLGREVAVVKDEVAEMGEQQVIFKNEDLPDGTYFITLSGDGLLQTIPVQIGR